jgi:signal transduction histidine kinase
VSVSDLFEESLGLINIPDNIVISRSVPGDLPTVQVDTGKICRAIGNILKNAVQAMPEGGTLSLAANEIDDSIVISLKDTGYGMKEDVRERIFDPFFSTREVGEGFGLGLAVAHGAVVQHGGQIEVESTEQEGTEFRIILPIWNESLEN